MEGGVGSERLCISFLHERNGSASDAVLAIIDSNMLDNNEIISASVSEAVEVFQIKKIIKRFFYDKSFHLKIKEGWTHSGRLG